MRKKTLSYWNGSKRAQKSAIPHVSRDDQNSHEQDGDLGKDNDISKQKDIDSVLRRNRWGSLLGTD